MVAISYVMISAAVTVGISYVMISAAVTVGISYVVISAAVTVFLDIFFGNCEIFEKKKKEKEKNLYSH